MISVANIVFCVKDPVFHTWPSQIKDYNIGICYFTAETRTKTVGAKSSD